MNPRHRAAALAAAAGAALVALCAGDVWILGRSLLSEGHPSFHRSDLARSAGAFVVAALGVLAIAALRPVSSRAASAATTVGAGSASGGIEDETWGWWLHGLSASFLALLLVSPEAFHGLALEGAVVEPLSFAACVAAAGLLLAVPWLRPAPGRAGRVVVVVVGLLLLLVAMEEVSWFQRQLGYATPSVFRSNIQGEANLHNLATNLFENLYYAGSFGFLVLLPAVASRIDGPAVVGWLPGRATMLGGTAMAALNYDMWRGLPTQCVFFTAVLILVADARSHGRRGAMLALAAVPVVVQLGFLIAGDRQVRMYDVTEYKELLIPLGFVAYGFELLRRTGRLRPAARRSSG